LAFYDYEYDAADRITAITEIDGRTDYRYDVTDQLSGATRGTNDPRGNETYRYDRNGNRISSHLATNFSTGTGNRLLADGTYNYSYDAEGNMSRRVEIMTGEIRDFTWDQRNRLVQVTDKSSGGMIINEALYTYDALNRRIAKTVDADGAGAGVPTTEHYVYDGEQVILEFFDVDGPGSAIQPVPVVRNLFGPGIDMILAQQQIGTGDTRWLLTDHLGTVRDLVGSTGLLLNHLQYDSFGNLLAQSVPTKTTRYGFTGRELDTSLGLYYYRARYYSPELGRFLQEDPLGFIDGTNSFGYVSNNPLIYTDPTGLFGIIGGIIGGGIDLSLQLSQNGWDFSCVNYWGVAGSAALGTLTGGLGSTAGRQGLTAGLRALSNPAKGMIGESLSTVKHTLRGSVRVATQTRIPGQRTIADSAWRARDNTIYYVESKFGTSGLTKAQRAAQRSMGDGYRVDRWTYPWIGDVGSRAGGTAGAAAGGLAGNAGGG
jgi:RHS repeat-associated protein